MVAKTGQHENTISLAAQASLAVRLSPSLTSAEELCFVEWLSGPFTKSVRRGSPDQLAKVVAWAQESNLSYAEVSLGTSSAVALAPMRYEDLPKVIAKLQVSGTNLPSNFLHPDLLASKLQLGVSEELTTGKAAAQAAHAMWQWALRLPDFPAVASLPARIQLLTSSELKAAAEAYPDLAVWDNGLTEVDPHTLTAVALPGKP